MNIRVSRTFLDPYNATSVELDDGSRDVVAQLGMYHELHCLVSSAELFPYPQLASCAHACITAEKDQTLYLPRPLPA